VPFHPIVDRSNQPAHLHLRFIAVELIVTLNAPNALADFVNRLTHIVDKAPSEAALLDEVEPLLAELISSDGWLEQAYRQASDKTYQQYLLYRDPAGRFSVASFVWGPGQQTPIHDHTVWGLIGVLQGAERCQHFGQDALGQWHDEGVHILDRGEVDRVSPSVGDVHRVANALADEVSISVHVYGADIGAVKRHVFDDTTFLARDFVSGYVNRTPLLVSLL
jgi:3-mercaptopropionate dioxygenase